MSARSTRARSWLVENLKPVEVDWILNRGRNLCLFPNLMLMDNPSTQIRLVKPVSAGLTAVSVYCIAPKGESRTARAARLREVRGFLPDGRDGDVGRCRRARSRPGRLPRTAKPMERHDPRACPPWSPAPTSTPETWASTRRRPVLTGSTKECFTASTAPGWIVWRKGRAPHERERHRRRAGA